MSKFKDIMIDIETLGNKPGAVILSIAAVYFNLETGETGEVFNRNIDLQSCLNFGLTIDSETFYWWMEQEKEAQLSFTKNRRDLDEVLILLRNFIKPECAVWGNSNRFDLSLLEAAYNAIGDKVLPWSHRNERDVRTLASLKPEIKKQIEETWKGGVNHTALSDCYKQINYCSAIYKSLNN